MRIDARQLMVELTALSLARFVELKLSGAPDIVFSDNYFDLPAGRSKKVTCPIPEGWTADQAENSLRVYTLYDSFRN
jgi:beta-mannosidase